MRAKDEDGPAPRLLMWRFRSSDRRWYSSRCCDAAGQAAAVAAVAAVVAAAMMMMIGNDNDDTKRADDDLCEVWCVWWASGACLVSLGQGHICGTRTTTQVALHVNSNLGKEPPPLHASVMQSAKPLSAPSLREAS